MKKKLQLKRLGLILLALLLITGSVVAQEYQNGMKQGVVRIKFQPELASTLSTLKTSYSNGIVQTGIQTLDAVNKEVLAKGMTRVFPYSPKFEAKHMKHGLHLWYQIEVSNEADVQSVINSYSQVGEIIKAEAVLERKLIQPGTVTKVEAPKISASSEEEPFNDPLLPRQWHYNNSGQTGHTLGADINLYKAWEITTGSKNVIVSIHDQGVDYKHEDLAEAMWVNQAELDGEEGVDDDGNGYVDDVHGFDFSGNKGTVDRLDHGTHVAGTVGAISNNGVGVAGVAGGSGNADGARIMSCQIIGGRSSDKVPASFVYAADNGAVISQNSWGYNSPGYVEQVILDAIDYFIAEAGNYEGSPMRGGVVIFAAGNDNEDGLWYPGCYENVIAVSALSPFNYKATYSNFDTWVDIAAPGGQAEDFNTGDGTGVAGYKTGILSTAPYNSYVYMDGTSMACPHVSGIAALVASKYGSADFTNEQLKAHLLIGTNDAIYDISYNQAFAGKLGIGAADAFGALAEDGKLAPNKITDFTLTGIAQDFVNFTWTVPADEDDIQAKTYKLYYYTDELTAENLKFADVINIETTKELGETMAYELEGLKSLTKYYFAIVGIDRWGNVSELSNVIEDTTNAGPDASTDAISTKYLTLDVNKAIEGDIKFNLINSGEGVLKWNTDINQSYINIYSSDKEINYPVLKSGKSSSVGSVKSIASKSVNAIVTHESSKKHFDGADSRFWTIGDTDKEMPNSTATRFYVDEEKGFNLTDVNARVFHREETGPVVLEIYKGENISDARLLLAQEITDTENQPWVTETNLDEDLYFTKGEYFWVVFHVPAGNLYPFAAALELEPSSSENCYISTNVGKSWAKLQDVYVDDQLVWQLEAISLKDHFGEYITLSPDSGQVLPNEQQEITASINAEKIPNGSYKSTIVINTNEPDEPMLRVKTSLSVRNHLPILKAPSVTEAPSVMVGNESIFYIQVKNYGYGKMQTPKFTVTDPQFELVGGLIAIPPRSTLTFPIRFKPTVAGNTNAIATLKDWKGNTVSFNLFGAGIEPPVMEVSEAQTFSDITIGDTISGKFTISNTGNYPLEYSMLKFADGSNIVDLDTNTCRSGYTNRINNGTMAPEEWIDIKNVADGNVSTAFKMNAFEPFSEPVEIGFEFPFFGKKETELYIVKYGMLSFDKNSTFNTLPNWYKNHYSPDRYISAQSFIYWWFATFEGEVYYKRYSDKFIVQYENLAYSSGEEGERTYYMNFQIILKDNGDIKINYKNWDYLPDAYKAMALIAIEDQTINDGVLITDAMMPKLFLKDNSSVEFLNPGLGIIDTVDKPFGKVQVGESTEISFTAITKDLNVQNYTERLAIISNDPANNPGVFEINLNVENGGAPEFILNKTDLDFGQVFQNDTAIREFNISNTGNAAVDVVSMVLDNDFYTIDGEYPVTLKGDRKLGYKLTLKSDVIGTYNDVLTITLSDASVHKVNLSAEVIAAPVFTSSVSEINESIDFGSTKTSEMIVENTGGNPLEFAIAQPEWMKVVEKGISTSNIPEFTYAYKMSTDAGGPTYQYEDIVSVDNRIPYLNMFDMELFWEEIELPFEFEFYNKNYSKMYIGANGLVSFTANQEGEYAFGGWNIPTQDPKISVDNFIAPSFCFAGFAYEKMYPETGIYYKAFEDRVVVTYNDFMNLFQMGTPISFQLILYKNGNIKFQYDLEGTDYTTQYGIVGVENEDGTDGVQIRSRSRWLKDKTAIILTPAKKQTIAAGESKTYELTVDATQLNDGYYASALSISTNDPLAKQVNIPANLTVNGEVEVSVSNPIEFGDLMAIKRVDAMMWEPQFVSYEKEFEITNNGSKELVITGSSYTDGTELTTQAFFKMMMWGTPAANPSWNDIGMLWDPVTVKPNETLLLKSIISPSGSLTEIADTLNINCNIEGGVISIPLSATVSFPPVVNISTEDIDIYAEDDNLQESRTIVIDNTDGRSELTYSLGLEFKRQPSAKSTSSSSYSVNQVAPEVFTQAIEAGISLKSTKEEEEFNRELYHLAVDTAQNRIGFGETNPFTAATKFTAPADGFNLSHVKTWYSTEGATSSKVIVDILGRGSSIDDSKVIYSEEIEYNKNEGGVNGTWVTLELSEAVALYPGEDFYISLRYQSGIASPQGLAYVENHIDDTFYFGLGGSWYETAAAGYEGLSWLVKAAEKTAPAGAWVELASDETGSIPAGESIEVNLDFNSEYASNGYNLANLVVSTNDPINPEKTVALTLYKNQAPEFEEDVVYETVKENEILTYTVAANDLEGDTITYSLKEEYENFTGETSEEGFVITYSPGYEAAGSKMFTVVVQDQFGNESEQQLLVDVINVNRAPELMGTIDAREYYEDEEFDYIDLFPVFTDPDNDELSYSVTVDNPIVTIFTSEEEIAIRPLEPGVAIINVVASDAEGLSAETSFSVTIGTVTGIEDPEGTSETKVYPVPTTGPLNIVLGNDIEGDITISIINVIGVTQYQTSVNKMSGEHFETLNISGMPSGIYLVKISSTKGDIVKRVVKM